MSDFNKGDFTQQGVDGHVRATLRLNEKRYVELDLTTNENARGCTISGNVHDRLNNLDYPIGAAKTIESKTITENGTYNASSDDCDGYNPVTVNVPQPSGNIAITENTAEGEPLDIAQYATATVNVSGGGGNKTANITFVPTFPNGEIFASVYLGTLTLNYEYELDGEPETASFTGQPPYNQTGNPVVTIPILDNATMVVDNIQFYDENAMGPTDYFTIDSSTITVSGNGELDGTDLVVTGDCTVTCTLRDK